jgi:hypothetical protein
VLVARQAGEGIGATVGTISMVPMAFRVPCATNSAKEFVPPDRATKGTQYWCPNCAVRVILKSGPKKRPHFAHERSAVCSAETVWHKWAKRLLEDRVSATLRGEALIVLIGDRCRGCDLPFAQAFPRHRVTTVQCEAPVASGHVVDVLLLDGGVPRLAVEVRVTHAVDSEKAAALTVPWLEVNAEEVVENPTIWRALRGKGLRVRCQHCEQMRSLRMKHAKHVRAWANLEFDPSQYPHWLGVCPHCNVVMLNIRYEGPNPPAPVPWTLCRDGYRGRGRRVVRRPLRTWSSACAHCHALTIVRSSHSWPSRTW